MLLRPLAYDALENVERISTRIMISNLQGNPRTTVISCYSPTNVSDENETANLYTELSALTRSIPRHNILIIGGDFNAHLGQEDGLKYSFHNSTNRNGNMIKDYLQENKLLCLNTHFQKRTGQKWTHKSPNNYSSQIDYIFINRKWKNSAQNCRDYNTFVNVASDHLIVTAHIILSLRANKKKNSYTKTYDWTTLQYDKDIRSDFVTRIGNKCAALQTLETEDTASLRYSHFETVCKESANEAIPLKPKLKKHIPWETADICHKREKVHLAANEKDTMSTQENICNLSYFITEFNEAHNSLIKAYEKEQNEYIQLKIDEIENAVTHKKTAIAWKAIYEISGRKKSNRARLEAKNDKERIMLWHNHFKELLDKKIISTKHINLDENEQDQDFKRGLFTSDELLKATKRIQNGKYVGLDEIPVDICKIPEMQEFLLECCNRVYSHETIQRWTDTYSKKPA